MSILFNTKLESLMKKQSEMTEMEKEHFLNELRKSELLVPLQIELDSLDLENMNLDGLNEINKEVKFHLKSFSGPDGKRTIPIFTDEENIHDVKLNTTVSIDEFLSLFDEEREFEDLMKEIEEEMMEDEKIE